MSNRGTLAERQDRVRLELERDCGIYRIIEKVGRHSYVGQSSSIKQRWMAHRDFLNAGKHSVAPFQKLWDMVGRDGFDFEVLETCLESQLNAREAHWIWKLRPTLNRMIPNPDYVGEIKEREFKRNWGRGKCVDCKRVPRMEESDRCMECERDYSMRSSSRITVRAA